MAKFLHRDQIIEKLEIARTIGLLTDFVVEPTDQGRRRDPSVTVARSPNVSDDVVKDYLIRLLQGLVLDHQIVVTAPFPIEAAPATVPVAA
jgi:hypothetical protein